MMTFRDFITNKYNLTCNTALFDYTYLGATQGSLLLDRGMYYS